MTQRIAAAPLPLAVFVDRAGRIESCVAESPRGESMLASAEFSKRIVGVFHGRVSVAELAAAVRAVA